MIVRVTLLILEVVTAALAPNDFVFMPALAALLLTWVELVGRYLPRREV